jgi:hypothetical protein
VEGLPVLRRQFNSLLVAGTGLAAAACASVPQDAADCVALPSANGLTEQDLRDYIAAFNRSDFPGFGKYYAEDVIFEGRGRNFRSRREVLDFYTEVKKRLRETVTIREIIVGEQDIAAEIETELYAFEDWPELVTGAIKKGEIIRTQNFVWYQVKDGKFVHIRSARYRKLA